MKKIDMAGGKGGIQKMTGRTVFSIVEVVVSVKKVDE